jgi:Methyltransferase domain
MKGSARRVRPELLDDLPADDPQAARSRRDLQRIHYAMATLSILQRALLRMQLPAPSLRILELGAGDGSLLLRLAHAMRQRWNDVDLTLLDRQDIVTAATRDAYQKLGWRVRVERAEVLSWANQRFSQRYDLCITTLFLHHFECSNLRRLLGAIAVRTDALIACEPRRNRLARVASHFVGVMGVNNVTREDAVTSVAAGFVGPELSTMWPRTEEAWTISECLALPFSHCFTAHRARAHTAGCEHGR